MNLKKKLSTLLISFLLTNIIYAQDYGDFPKINRDSLLLDFELLKQGLEKFHTGLYWYTPKDSFNLAFEKAEIDIDRDMNVMEFHKIIAPLISLTKEDHTNISLSSETNRTINREATFLPLTVKFLGTKMIFTQNRSGLDEPVLYHEVETINGETPQEIVSKLSTLYANDGNIQPVKYSDLDYFNFSLYYYFYYGNINAFEIKLSGISEPFKINALLSNKINANQAGKYLIKNFETRREKVPLIFRIISDSIAYIGAHTFSNSDIKTYSEYKDFSSFLKKSFKTISEKKIKTLIIDVSHNGGGSEGNEGMLYSYIGENYQKYAAVSVKNNKVVLNNGVDTPVTLKTYGFIERLFTTNKMPDGSLDRKNGFLGFGLMAYKKEPEYKFKGNKIFVMISPLTYSGGSEFANMVYTRNLATFAGQETGGGYYGNTSGYGRDLVLPHSKITIEIPALQFQMKVDNKIPLGRGVIPHFEIIPTIAQYERNENVTLNFILNQLLKE